MLAERAVEIVSPPLETACVFEERGLAKNVKYELEGAKKRAVGFELAGSFFVITGEY